MFLGLFLLNHERRGLELERSDNVLEKNICNAAWPEPVNLVVTCDLPIPVFLS